MRNSTHNSTLPAVPNSVLVDLFNIPVALVAKQPADYCDQLGIRESQLAQSMRSSRLLDFSTGRVCAHEALRSIGLTVGDIDSGEHRQPLWPEGIRGSISHCKGIAVAVVTDSLQCLGLGLDIEPLSCLDRDVMHLVCTKREIEWFEKSSDDHPIKCDSLQAGNNTLEMGHLACLFFSIKEAIFKCYFPLYEQWFDFKQASVMLEPDSGSWCVRLDPDLPFATVPPQQQLYGRFHISNGYCVSSAVLTNTV